MVGSPPDEWYRSAAWDAAAQRLFEVKLKRARAWNRPQYLRIKGLALLEAGDAQRRDGGRDLLRRVIDEYPEAVLDLVVVHAALGRSLADEGDVHGATSHLRAGLALERGHGGVSAGAALTLAEVLTSHDPIAHFDEAWDLLIDVASDELALNSGVWRIEVARARLQQALGNTEFARNHAQRALADNELSSHATRPSGSSTPTRTRSATWSVSSRIDWRSRVEIAATASRPER